MRVKLTQNNLRRLFKNVLLKEKNWQRIAIKLHISDRTLRDWRSGVLTIPLKVFKKLIVITGFDEQELSPSFLSDYWYTKNAGRKGGYVATKLHGNFGTPHGRRKGGLASIKTHKLKSTKFQNLKTIIKPKHTEKLAEFLGIMIGDGHLSKYQIRVTTNSKTDHKHAMFVCNLIKGLFQISSTIRIRRNTIDITASSKKLVQFLHCKGMPIGNKIQNNLSVPKWIYRKKIFQKAFIRGLFDTDGCIYVDIHKTKKKIYKHLGWTITSYADNLIKDVIKILKYLGFSPTHQHSQKSVYLRRQDEIIKYFSKINTSNSKHHKRYLQFFEK